MSYQVQHDRFKVVKQVVQGKYYQEHQHTNFPETFVGRWKKVGVQISARCEKMLTCEACAKDYENRMEHRTRSLKDIRSYRVVGVTEPDDLYRWEFGRCTNTQACWGPNIRIWDVRRSKNSGRHYFAHHMVINNIEQTQDKMYANFVRSARNQNLSYTAIACKASQTKEFWPDLLPIVERPRRQIHISMESRGVVPENVLPDISNNRNEMWRYPNKVTFRYFDEVPGENLQAFKDEPKTIHSMEKFLPEIARTVVQMYPGGSGLKVSQYRALPSESTEDTRFWFVDGNEPGWSGPVISFWARLDATNRYFA